MKTRIALIILSASLAACGGHDAPSLAPPELWREVQRDHVALARDLYAAALAGAQDLESALGALATSPAESTLAAAQEAWTRARPAYGRSEALRFAGGPIDRPEDGVEGYLNAWPVDESFLESEPDRTLGGIVQNTVRYPQITETLLLSLHEQGGEENVATGWHAIEFLLWGPDRSPTGPGDRAATLFDPAHDPHALRRHQVLGVLSHLLVRQLADLAQSWAPDAEPSYGRSFAALPSTEALRRILNGLTTFVIDELAAERLHVAWETRDPENEQSCFSDTTLADLMANLEGVRAVWRGHVAGSGAAGSGVVGSGKGPADLVAASDPGAARAVGEGLERAKASLAAIPTPFDQSVTAPQDSAPHAALRQAILELNALGNALIDAAQVLDIAVDVRKTTP